MAPITNSNASANAENNFFTNGFESNPLKPTAAEIAELQYKSDMAKSVYQLAKGKVSSLMSKRNSIRASSIWNYNRGNKIDTSLLDKTEQWLSDAKSSCLSADMADDRARSALRDRII